VARERRAFASFHAPRREGYASTPANGTGMTDAPRSGPIVPIVASVVWGVLFFAGLLAAMMSPMMFDDARALSNPRVISMFVGVVSFPVLCLVSIVATWFAWRFTRDATVPRRRRLPLLMAALPIVSLVVFAIAALLQGDATFAN
jgi:cytochrome bd-type quinol oxidase subunit 1